MPKTYKELLDTNFNPDFKTIWYSRSEVEELKKEIEELKKESLSYKYMYFEKR